jgi:hypothetical protein
MLGVVGFCMKEIRFTDFSAQIVGGSNRDAKDHSPSLSVSFDLSHNVAIDSRPDGGEPIQ